jgi:PIN domain nuclease of toxin-antitoxin system
VRLLPQPRSTPRPIGLAKGEFHVPATFFEPLPEEPDRYLPKMRERSGIELLPIGEAEACQTHRLPTIHRDPFDRLLVAQANCHGLVIVTDDPVIARYPVQTIW